MRNLYGLIAVVLLVLISIPAYGGAQVPDHLSVVVADPVLVANGMDVTPVTVTVLDSENNTISDVPVYYILENNEFGGFSPGQSNTSPSGIAETQFQVKKVSGWANFSVRVQYGSTDYMDFPAAGQIRIQNPIPDTITFETTKEWLVANGTDSAFAEVVAYNQSYPIPNLVVSFHVHEPEMGTFQPDISFTDIDGTAQSRFTVKYKSGNATLKSFIRYEWEETEYIVEQQYIQKIDHDTPYNLSSYNVPSEVSVGSITPLIMTYRDRWGNPIDDRRIAENVTFMVSSPIEDALFVYTGSMVATIPVNPAGEAIAWLQASISPSINVVRVDPDMGTIPDKYFFIQAIANRSPVRIVQVFEPEGYMGNPPKLYSDGNSRFSIEYIVTDEFQNGVMNTPVEVTTWEVGTGTKVEELIVFTNSFGQALLTYGPKTSIGKYKIVARAIGNTTSPPSCEKEIWFVSQEAEDLQFTAVPDNMASRDVDGWEPAMLMAKVIDENGNPVGGETVTFSIGAADYEKTPEYPVVTANPELVATSAITDSDGFAIVSFRPGAFTTNWTDPDYDDTASGSCTATAYWENVTIVENVTRVKSATRSLVLTWKNYPYLSIETAVSPQTANVSGTVNVKVSMKGDGWALRPKPIDAVLCTDRSGSMLKDNPDRMVSVMGASKAFVGSMHVGPTRDHIGLVSFGHNGIAKLAPEYRYLSGTYRCYGTTTAPPGWKGTWYSGWRDRPLQGWFWDWTGMYGVTSTSNDISSSGFRWVYRDSNWDMPTTPTTYNNQNVWPYTFNYDAGSVHQNYVNTHYPGSPKNYADYAVVEQQLTDNPAFINASINMMVPVGGTPMRYGIYGAINEVIARGRTNAIRAVIVLGDGDYNWYGDPLARGNAAQTTNPENEPYRTNDQPNTRYWPFSGLTGSEQNLSNYAKNNNIRIYSIGYGEDITNHSRNTLRVLAESTGGQYFDGNAANIEDIYKTIAGQLQEEAGVDTMMDLEYDQIEVNYHVVTVNETYRVFEYVPATQVDSYYQNKTRPDGYPYSIDQSDEFNGTYRLNFSVGTIKLGQTWEAMYTLQVLVDGNINVFGENSIVHFNGTQGPSQLRIPKTYITGVPNMTSEGIENSTLEIAIGASSETETNIITWPIIRSYTGEMNVKEDYYISTDGGMTWLLLGFNILTKEEANKPSSYVINRNQYPFDAVLKFRVVANALDAPGPVIALSDPSPRPPAANRPYIILK